jgi:hypothetical protein
MEPRHPAEMSRLRGLNTAQRVVLVIGLAGVLGLADVYIVTKGFSGPSGGWFAYAPNTNPIFSPDADHLGPFATWLLWLGTIVLWTSISLWLLGLSEQSGRGDEQ